MSERGAEIEGVLSALTDFEKEADEVKSSTEDMKRKLLALARAEAEHAKEEATRLAASRAQVELQRATGEAEAEARKILAGAEADAVKLKERVEKAFDDAVEEVAKILLGE